MGDNKALVLFEDRDNLNSFLGLKESCNDYFTDIRLHFWNLDFFKLVGDECEQYITVALSTFSRSRLDVGQILVSNCMDHILKFIHLNENDMHVFL